MDFSQYHVFLRLQGNLQKKKIKKIENEQVVIFFQILQFFSGHPIYIIFGLRR